MKINHQTGDATQPHQQSIITHICDDAGTWGTGFTAALSQTDKTPENDYRNWHKKGKQTTGIPFQLGQIQLTRHHDNLVATMIAKDNTTGIQPPIRYDALRECLEQVTFVARKTGLPVVAPKFGTGLAGGDWNHIETIINDTLTDNDIPVTIYTQHKSDKSK